MASQEPDTKIFKPTNFISTNVTAIKYRSPILLTGVAGYLKCYHQKDDIWSWDLINIIHVFDSQNIHGIVVRGNDYLVYGGKWIALIQNDDFKYYVKWRFKVSDWISSVHWSDKSGHLSVLSANNKFVRYSITQKGPVVHDECVSSDRSILYSSFIIDGQIVLSGTVYNEILIWCSKSTNLGQPKEILNRLCGHKGVIFSVNYDPVTCRICSTSDDRTVRLWKVQFNSEDEDVEQLWKKSLITLTCTIFGHTARVWRSYFLSGSRVVSIGEDSLISVWTETGQLENQWSGHQGGVVWSIDGCENEGFIVTGGIDGAVSLWPLIIPCQPVPLSLPECDPVHNPKHCAFLQNQIVVTTDKGRIFIRSNNKWKLAVHDKRLSNYSVQDVCPNNKSVLFGSIHGHVILYKLENNELIQILDEKPVSGRIFSVNWITGIAFLVCGPQGNLIMWKLNQLQGPAIWEKLTSVELPECKERWPTCAQLLEDWLLCGDRLGSIHLYNLTNTDLKSPVQTLKKLHGSRGVSCIKKIQGQLFSTGRDGTIRQLRIVDSHLQLQSTDKLKIDWAARILHTDCFGPVILGFHEMFFIVWSLIENRYLLRINCGGGHRSWDCQLNENANQISIAYIKDKFIHFCLNSLAKLSCCTISQGYHTKTINTCSLVVLDKQQYILSGGEDCTVRIARLTTSVSQELVLHKHISSIRASDAVTCNRTVYACTAGGRAQLKVWSLTQSELQNVVAIELASHMVRGEIRRPWQQATPLIDPETRHMDVSIVKLSNEHLVILAASSDGFVRSFGFDLQNNQLLLKSTFGNGINCILKLNYEFFNSQLYCIIGLTNGQLKFWKLNVPNCDDALNEGSFYVHTLGINSCNTLETENGILVATGGDDALLCLTMFELVGSISIASQWKDSNCYSCQVTGITLTKSHIISCSLDQRLTIHKWTMSMNKLKVTQLHQCITSIPDIHGLLLWNTSSSCLEGSVYGLGIQTFSCDIEETEQD